MINKLVEKIKKTGAPIVVGLDPMLNYIPKHVQDKAFAEYGETLEGAAEAIWQFNKEIVDKTYDLIPAVKPQIAMYEQFGVPGVMAFKKTVDYCKEKDLVVIGDIKRGDIGSTSAAYATGHLGKVKVGSKEYVPFDEDFATVNPYLGSDGVNPFINVCKEEKKGIFVLVKTSNPSSGEFQDRLIDGRPLYELAGEKVAEWGADCMGDEYSYVGAVVGATYPEMGKVLRKIMPKAYILVPGYGAQGGQGKDLVHFFNEDGLGAIVNSSRGIIAAYKQEAYAKYGEENFGDASRAAGASDPYIILNHILPNSLAPLIVQATLKIGGAILSCASMSFIGLGIVPPTPEWGAMLSTGRDFLRDAPHLTAFPGMAIMFAVFAMNLMGDGLRDALDPKLKN